MIRSRSSESILSRAKLIEISDNADKIISLLDYGGAKKTVAENLQIIMRIFDNINNKKLFYRPFELELWYHSIMKK